MPVTMSGSSREGTAGSLLIQSPGEYICCAFLLRLCPWRLQGNPGSSELLKWAWTPRAQGALLEGAHTCFSACFGVTS